MPTIEQSLSEKLDMSNYTKVDHPSPASTSNIEPVITRNVFLRCPVPPQGAISVDDIDQFNRNGVVPQYRVFLGDN